MQGATEKLKDMASEAKEKIKKCTAKTEEKVEKATAASKKQKELAHERAKAKEAEAEMEKHQEKAEHKAQRDQHHRANLGIGGHGHLPLTSGGTHRHPSSVVRTGAGAVTQTTTKHPAGKHL